MKTPALIFAMAMVASRVMANGDPEPEPEPPKAPPVATITTESRDPHASFVHWPCCIQAGQVVPQRNMLLGPKATRRMCEKAIARGDAVILECSGVVSPEATK